jgi:hypothetical protein
MADGADLLRLEHAADPDHDRSGGLGDVPREQRPFGQDEVNAGELDPVDRPDGAGELALEGAQVIDVLDEAGGAEGVGLVEDLVADAAALGQARFGELHPQPGDLVLGHHDDGAVVAQLIGDGLAIELLDDAGGVLVAQIGEQRGHLRGGHPQDHEGEEADESQRDGRHGRQACRAQRFQKSQQPLQRTSPMDSVPTSLGKICPWYGFHMVNAG